MYSKINYTIVGIFVTIFTVALFAFAFWLSKNTNSNDYKLYKIYFKENVSGLHVDSSVKLKGVDIGKVVSIDIDKKNLQRVEVLVKIKKDIPITKNMVAYLEPVGITGLLNIVIEGGSSKYPLLKSINGKIPVIKSRPSWIVSTKNSVTNISKNLNESLIKFNKLLDMNNINNFSITLENLKDISFETKNLEKNLTKILKNTNKTILVLNNKLEELDIKRVNQLFLNFDKNMKLLTKNTIPMLKSIKNSSDSFKIVVKKVNKGLDRGNYNLKAIFEPSVVDLRILTNSITNLVRDIQNSPSDFLFKSREIRKGPGE